MFDQLYKLADTLKSRLQRVIQLKLDDAALEMMCSVYTRNQKLKLSPADVHFLQPAIDQFSEVLSFVLPNWIQNHDVLLYYLLQQLSMPFLTPVYTTFDDKNTVNFQTPPHLTQILNENGLPIDIQQDYLFLYIRPVNKGRGN